MQHRAVSYMEASVTEKYSASIFSTKMRRLKIHLCQHTGSEKGDHLDPLIHGKIRSRGIHRSVGLNGQLPGNINCVKEVCSSKTTVSTCKTVISFIKVSFCVSVLSVEFRKS